MTSLNDLPIFAVRSEIITTLKQCPRLVLQAPTGSGKSTQVPQFLLDAGLLGERGQVIVLQPRRVAARMLAKRVSEERSSPVGGVVGFQIRFDNVASRDTRIKFVTEGILLRQILDDPKLKGISAIIFDEFHERNLFTDLTLALAKKSQNEHRPDLLLIVMSATLDGAPLAKYLDPCTIVKTEGRMFPVDIEYSANPAQLRTQNIWDKAALAARRISRNNHDGNMLIFMPGAREIHRTLGALEKEGLAKDFDLVPLYGELSPQMQDRALEKSDRRKIIVSTNIAETSLTIPGVITVIDSGLARVNRYDPNRGLNTLFIENICKSSAEQRAGRAGRLCAGTCIRLWGMQEHIHRVERLAPEINRIDLSDTLLLLKASGIQNLDTLTWFEVPRKALILQATQLLQSLGALDNEEKITPLGHRMAGFPMHPRFARLMISGEMFDCVSEICDIVAIAEERRILLPLSDKRKENAREELLGAGETSDFFPLMEALRLAQEKNFNPRFCEEWGIHAASAARISQTADQYRNIAERQKMPLTSTPADDSAIRRCLLCGFIDHLAIRTSEGTLHCRMTGSKSGELRRESVVRGSKLLVFAEVEEQSRPDGVKLMLGLATAVEFNWLKEEFPHDFVDTVECVFDEQQRRVLARRQQKFRDLILVEEDSLDVPKDQAAHLLTQKIMDESLQLKNWGDDVKDFIARINFVASNCPEYGIAELGEDGRRMILEQMCYGYRSYKEIKDLDPLPSLRAWLSHEQILALNTLAPEEWELPRRKRPVKLRYEPNKVILAATIQELYDVSGKQLHIADGKVPLTIELLAPNRRPIQITQDLDNFWAGAYPSIRKELKGRYPKHEWR